MGPAASALFLVGACSGSGGTPNGSPAARPTESPEVSSIVPASEYLADVCGAVTSWLADIQTLNERLQQELDRSSVEVLKESTIGFFDDVVVTTDSMIARVEDAGVPDVEGGELAAGQVITALGAARDALQDARDRVAVLETDDGPAFSAELQVIAGEMGVSLSQVATAMDAFGSPVLDAAAAEIPACQELPA
jgi:hypothetical protein